MITKAAARTGTLASRHPLIFYFALTYSISWPLWLLSRLTGGTLGTLLLVTGGFGPAIAAAVTLRRSGGSLSDWARRIVRWRVPVVYYAYALALPPLIMVVLNLGLTALGVQPDWSAIAGRMPAYLQTFLLTALVFGGQEEPGWRGFALPRLQQQHSPLVATLILGLAWGVWHIPLYGLAGFVVPLVLAFFYTWLYNKTGSVLLCILLHASFTPAQDHLLLTDDSPTVDVVLLATYVVAAGVLVLVTRARLGFRDTETPSQQSTQRGLLDEQPPE